MYIRLLLSFFHGIPTALAKILKNNLKTKKYKKLLITLSVNNNIHNNDCSKKQKYILFTRFYLYFLYKQNS